MKEEALFRGELEPTNEMYALAKLFALRLCDAYRQQYGLDFRACIPCNLYGEGDRCCETSSHVIPSLTTLMHKAKEEKAPFVEVWGDGSARREFLHVQDLVEAALVLMKAPQLTQTVNVGSGTDISIRELALIIQNVTGYLGQLLFDSTRPIGVPRKLLDCTKIKNLNRQQGLETFYEWYLQNVYSRASC